MRRQVKPFVTEYRGTPRRKDSLGQMPGSSDMPQERDEPRRNEPQRFASGAVSEDSYEAAMRAADALFSSPSPRPPQDAPATRAFDQAQPDFDQPDFGAGDRNAAHQAPEVRVPGRILPAMDQPQVDPFAELEAERAPKRRGRKPGSKNKPKIPALMSEQPVAFSLEAFSAEDEDDEAIEDGDVTIEAESTAAMPVDHVVHALLPQSAPRAAVSRTRGDNRFAWVRTRLRPGQKWKRRLPKVAW